MSDETSKPQSIIGTYNAASKKAGIALNLISAHNWRVTGEQTSLEFGPLIGSMFKTQLHLMR